MAKNTCVMCGRSVARGTDLHKGRQKAYGKVYFEGTHYCPECVAVDELAEKIAHDYGWDDAVTMQLFVLALERLPDSTPWKKEMKTWWESKSYMDGANEGDLIIEAVLDNDDNIIASRTLTGEERARFEREFQ
jgi:hypothetical protein